VKLTPIEYAFLRVLARNAGKVVTQRQILTEVWGPNATEQTQYLRVYATHLRNKLEANPSQPEIVLTEPGVGYRLVDLPAANDAAADRRAFSRGVVRRHQASQFTHLGQARCAFPEFGNRILEKSARRSRGERLPQRMFVSVVQERFVVGLIQAPQFKASSASEVAQILALLASLGVPRTHRALADASPSTIAHRWRYVSRRAGNTDTVGEPSRGIVARVSFAVKRVTGSRSLMALN
jgi:hypothetical protein